MESRSDGRPPRVPAALSSVLTAAILSSLALPAVAQEGPRFRCGTPGTGACNAPDSIRFTSISAGYTHSCALTRDGVAWCWGDGRKGALGDSALHVQRWPQRVATRLRFIEIRAGRDFTCARTREGAIYCWGTERTVPGSPNAATVPARVSTSILAQALTVGRRHACLLDAGGRASCWGFNVDAETGTGTAGMEGAIILTPTAVAGDHTFRSLSAGSGFTCGLTTENAVLCWGSNIDGAVGEAARDRCGEVAAVSCSVVPVAVPLDRKVANVSAGASHVCAVGGGGTVFCWGSNALGQFGFLDQKTPVVRSPRAIEFGRDVRMLSVHSGGIHSCGMSDRAQLLCWGADSKSLTDVAYWAHELGARVVGDGTRFSAVSVGQIHFCVLDTAGRARCWGDTMLGGLGNR